MTNFESLNSQVAVAWHRAGRPGSLDAYATAELKGLRTKVLPNAGLVQRGVVTTRQRVEIVSVSNQGFNGQVAFVKVVSTGERRSIALKDLRPVG
jgi:hypothetical protein